MGGVNHPHAHTHTYSRKNGNILYPVKIAFKDFFIKNIYI